MKKIILFTVFSFALFAPDSSSACGDPCGFQTRFYYQPSDLSGCYEPLPFFTTANDSRMTLQQLLEVYGPKATASPSNPNGKTANEPAPDADDEVVDERKELQTLLDAVFADDPSKRPSLEIATPDPSYPKYDFIDVRQSNTLQQAREFILAARKSADPAEVKELAHKRIQLLTNPDQVSVTKEEPKLKSADFQTYLLGVQQLYKLGYAEAEQAFCSLGEASNAWLREAAAYSCARAALLVSQIKWDGYSETTGTIEREALARAVRGFEAYVQKYPEGLYTDSAKGLLTRAAYLGANWTEYQRQFGAAFAAAEQAEDGLRLDSLADEFDRIGWRAFETNRMLNVHPLLDAGHVLRLLRKPDDGDLVLVKSWLAADKDRLNRYPGLFELVDSEVLLAEKRYEDRIGRSSEFEAPQVHLALQSGAADALEALGRWDDAIKLREKTAAEIAQVWPAPQVSGAADALPYQGEFQSSERSGVTFVSERGQLALLRTLLRARRVDALLGAYREKVPSWAVQIVIQALLDEDKVKALCPEKLQDQSQGNSQPAFVSDAACRTLMRIYLYSKRYKEAAALYESLPPRVRPEFEAVKGSLAALAAPKPSAESLTGLGEFIIDDADAFDEFNIVPNSSEAEFFSGVIGTAGFREAAALRDSQAPIYLFESAMKAAKAAGQKEAEAAAVVDFLNCFRSGTWAGNCQGKEARGAVETKFPVELRKSLFKRLKGPLGKTEAAQNQQYWY